MISSFTGMPVPSPPKEKVPESLLVDSTGLPVPLSPVVPLEGLLGISGILEEDPLTPPSQILSSRQSSFTTTTSLLSDTAAGQDTLSSTSTTTTIPPTPCPLEPLWKEVRRVTRDRSVNELTFLLSTAAKFGPYASLVLGQQESPTGALHLQRMEAEAELVNVLRGADHLRHKTRSRNVAVLDSYAVDRSREAYFLLTQSQAVPVSAWIERNQAKLRGLTVQLYEEDLALRLRIAVQTARGLVSMAEAGMCPRRLSGESVTVDEEVATVVVTPDVLPCSSSANPVGVDGHGKHKKGSSSSGATTTAMHATMTAVKQYGHFLIHLFTGRRPNTDGTIPPLAISCSDIIFGESLPGSTPTATSSTTTTTTTTTTLAAGVSAPAAGGNGVAVAGGYLDEIQELKELVEKCVEDDGTTNGGRPIISMEMVMMAMQRLQFMRCAKVAAERVEKKTGREGGSGWVLRPRNVCLYISPGAVVEIISKIQTLPDRRPYRMWTSKLLICLQQALHAYESWMVAVSGGECEVSQVESMFASLSVMLPRTFCEATSKAFITALDLPFLFTSYEAFKHVRDALTRYHANPRVMNSPRLVAENQKRIDTLNNLLYLRGLSAGDHDRAVEVPCPLVIRPTTLADEILNIFTDIYRTLHALGFEEATSFDSIVQVVMATSESQRTNLFFEGLGTEP